MNRTLITIVIAFALVVAACGDDSNESTTVTTTAASTTAVAAATTSTAGPGVTPASGDAAVAVEKSDAVVEAAPDGWTVAVSNTLASEELIEQELLFGPCLEDGSFDIATVDALSLAAINTSVTAPISGESPLGATASIEVRVFESESAATDAYTVLETVLGTTTGRACVGASSFALLSEQLPEGASAEYKVEELLLATGDFGTSITWVVEMDGATFNLFLDMVGYRDGACTVFAVFIGFGEPFPTLPAVDMMSAATSA